MPGPMGGRHGGPGGPHGPMGGPMGGHHGGPRGPHGPMGYPPPHHYGGYRRLYYRSGCLGSFLTFILGCGSLIVLAILALASIFLITTSGGQSL